MNKKPIVALLIISMITGSAPLIPLTAFAAETKTGISSYSNDTFSKMGFDTESSKLKQQAEDTVTPYGKGNQSLVSYNELVYVRHDGVGESQDYTNDGSNAFKQKAGVTYQFQDVDAVRSAAFDPFGEGKANFIATVSSMLQSDGTTTITLSIDTNEKTPDGDAFEPINITLSKLYFKTYAESAGAWLSIAVGNFDGDDLNTQEIAVYRPYAAGGAVLSGGSAIPGSVIEILKLEENFSEVTLNIRTTRPGISTGRYSPEPSGTTQKVTKSQFDGYTLKSIKTLNLNDNSATGKYFYDLEALPKKVAAANNGSLVDWKTQYLIPGVALETVSQPSDYADDLCITINSALGGAVVNRILEKNIEMKTPFDTATAVTFWVDPIKNNSTSAVSPIRYRWTTDYSVSEKLDKNASKKSEIMLFGSSGSGDINSDGYNEVVVGGYVYGKRDQAFDGTEKDDWTISDREYGVTYFTYNPDSKTYSRVKQPMSWISLKKGDYEGATALGEGIYTNYGEKDMMHTPLPVTCFADRGSGYGDSVAIGGIICTLNTDASTSKWTPYDDKGLGTKGFDYGVFDPAYAIPTEYIHKSFGHAVQNRLFTETAAGNFDGNALGREQLAFAYVGKKSGENRWSSAYGLISQTSAGERDDAVNLSSDDSDKYLGKGIRFSFYKGIYSETRGAAASVCAADTDNDSVILRYKGIPNDYFFSDPNVIAVLQASPYFAELDYNDAGETSIEMSSGTTNEHMNGVTVGLQVMLGAKYEILGNKTQTIGGLSGEFEKSWGKGDTRTHALTYSAGLENSVALVMTPYVRYYYEIFNADTNSWDDFTVDSPQTPRASIITVSKYDEVALQNGWETIGGNIIKNTAGKPATYDSTIGNKKNFDGGEVVGVNTPTNFVKVGYGDSSGAMAQTISGEDTKITNKSWSAMEVFETETVISSFIINVSQSLGWTGSISKVDFDGYEYVGEVTSIPNGFEDYSFAWQFGKWDDSIRVTKDKKAPEQDIIVLGYLVKDIMQPMTYPENFHVVDNQPYSLTMAWKQPDSMIGQNAENGYYTIYRYQDGVYYPLYTERGTAGSSGWFLYTDENVEPFSEYIYSTNSKLNNKYNYEISQYSPLLYAYTQPEGDNIPKAVIKNTGGNYMITPGNTTNDLTVTVTPAVGDNTGEIIMQWQHYERDNGGWTDIAGLDATTDTIKISSSEESPFYRCRVSQRIGSKIYTVYSNTVTVKKAEISDNDSPSPSAPVIRITLADIDIGYNIGTAKPDGPIYWEDGNYSYPVGTEVMMFVTGGTTVVINGVEATPDSESILKFTVTDKDTDITISRKSE